MNNPRGTYMNKTKPNTHMTSAAHIDRITANNMSVTKGQQDKNIKDQERCISHILEGVARLQNPTNTPAISRETLKTGSTKAFFDVLCIFFRAIDGSTQRSDFNGGNCTELLMDALRVFGYKGSYSRSTFQPIGAPHTWTQCLCILEWFSELANFSYNFQAQLQEQVFQDDINSLILASFSTKNQEPIGVFLTAKVESLEAELTTNSYSVESKQMAVRNQHAAQKELALVQRELEKEKELAYRARQEEMAVQSQVRAIEASIEAKQEELTQAQEREAQSQATLDKIRYEIAHQDLPPEECDKIKLEIRDTKNKIAEIEQGITETLDIQKTENNQYLQRFTDKASVLRKLTDKLAASTILADLQSKPQVPTLAPLEFREVLIRTGEAEAMDLESQAKLQAIFKEREFFQYFRKQDELLGKLQARLGKEEEALVAREQQVQGLDSKSKDYQQNISRLDRSKKAKLSKVSLHQAEKKELEHFIADLQQQILTYDQEIAQKSMQRDQLLEEVKEGLANLRELEEVCRENEKIRKERLTQTRENVDRYKQICLDKIAQYKRDVAAIFSRKFEGRPENH